MYRQHYAFAFSVPAISEALGSYYLVCLGITHVHYLLLSPVFDAFDLGVFVFLREACNANKLYSFLSPI